MRILLTNDDGIFAEGLAAIYEELKAIGDVVVVAPADGQSGAGHSITFAEPLLCNKVDVDGRFTGYGVHGSPADCVKLGVRELLDEPVDLIVSGINLGANVGINVFYSGTVAAAIEGAFFRIPAVAMSLASEEKVDFKAAAKYCIEVLKKVLPLSAGEVININIPRLSAGEPKGVKVVGQSTSGFEEYYVPRDDEQGKKVFKLMGSDYKLDGTLTDTHCLVDGYITVTSLHFDMTDYEKMQRLREIKW